MDLRPSSDRRPPADQAQGLRRLFARAQLRIVPVLANPHMPFSGVLLERLCAALEGEGARTLVVDPADSAPRTGELARPGCRCAGADTGGRRAGRRAPLRCGWPWRLSLLVLRSCFALPDPALLAVLLALGVWAVVGGIGAPGLEAHIASLSDTHRGVLLALSTSAANLGVALSAALAGEAYLRGTLWVAGLGVIMLSISVMALARPRSRCSAAGNVA